MPFTCLLSVMFLLPNKCFNFVSILTVFSFLLSSAEVVLHYEFNEADATVASSAANTGTSLNTVALSDGYGTMNGIGQLVVSEDAGRINTSMGAIPLAVPSSTVSTLIHGIPAAPIKILNLVFVCVAVTQTRHLQINFLRRH